MASSPSSTNLPKAFLVLLLLVLALNLGLIAPYLLALFLGWILATVLAPLYVRMSRKTKRHRTSSLIATLIATFTIILPIGAFGFLTVKNLIRIVGPYAKSGVDPDVWVVRLQKVPLVNRAFEGPEEIRAF